MPMRDIKTLYEDISAARSHLDAVCLFAFRRLKELDAQVYDAAVQTLETEGEAAYWFSDPIEAFGNRTAWEALLAGDRPLILDVLARMEHGVYG